MERENVMERKVISIITTHKGNEVFIANDGDTLYQTSGIEMLGEIVEFEDIDVAKDFMEIYKLDDSTHKLVELTIKASVKELE